MTTNGDVNQPGSLREADPWELSQVVLAMRRHLRASVAIVLGCLVLGAASLLLPKSYIAEATLAYAPQLPLVRGGGDAPLTDPERDAQIDAQLAQVASLPVAETVARTVDLAANPRLAREADRWAARSDRPLSRTEALAAALLDHVKARRVGQTSEFAIGFTAETADQAARIANDFAASYLATALQQKAALATASARQVAARIAQLRQQAAHAERDLAAFRIANELPPGTDTATLDQEVASLRGQLADARGQAALASTRDTAADAGAVVGGGAGGTVDTAPVSVLTQQRATQVANLAALRGRLGERHPDVIVARERLVALDAELAQAQRSNGHSAAAEAQAATARAAALAGSLAEAQARLTATLSHDAQLLDLQNSALAARQAYQDVLKISADQAAQLALVQPDAQQIATAQPPLRPQFPRAGINLLAALVAGSGIAVLVAFVRESWMHTLSSVGDVGRWLETDYFAPLPLLGSERATCLSGPSANSFRSLGTAALAAAGSCGGSGGRVIGIISALAGEGKTTAGIAMGCQLAHSGMTVVLIMAPGHAEKCGPEPCGLAMMTSSNSDALLAMIAALRRDYQVVIIDLPPALAGGVNRQVLASTDALIMLARWRKTPVRVVREALQQIAVAGGRVTGVALSMVDQPVL